MGRMTHEEIELAMARCIAGNMCRWVRRRGMGADVETERCNVLNLGLYAYLLEWPGLTEQMRFELECKATQFCHCLGPCKDSAVVTLSQDVKGITTLRGQTWQHHINTLYVVSEDEKPIKDVKGNLYDVTDGGNRLEQVIPGKKYSDTVYQLDVRGPLDVENDYRLQVEVSNYCGTVIVTEPIGPAPCVLELSAEVTPITCNGSENGEVVLTPSGGTAPYVYEWSVPFAMTNPGNVDNAVHLIPGDYAVKVTDDEGCVAQVVFTLTEPTRLGLNLTDVVQPGEGTSNGSLTVTPSGGTAPYTYQWYHINTDTPLVGQTSATAAALPKGTYWVIVTDANGCEVTLGPINLEHLLT